MDARLSKEIAQGKKIADTATHVWGWGTPAGELRWRRRVDFFVSIVQPRARILEIGCGTGELTKNFASKDARVISVDISVDLLKKAVEKARGPFLIQDAQQLGLADGAFGMVIGNSVLHHLDIAKALREIYRVLAPGGSMHFFEPNMANPQIMLQKNIPFLKKAAGDTPHETAFFRWSLKNAMTNAGFRNIRIKNTDFLHPATPVFLIPFAQKLGLWLESIFVLREFSGSLLIEAEK